MSSRSARVPGPRRLTWLVLSVLAAPAATLEAADVPTYGAVDGGPSVLLSNAGNASPYSGVVRYFGRAQCTGVFLATLPEGIDPGPAPAYVLTNGHCPAFPGANEVIVEEPAPANHRVVFNYFADTPARQFSVPVARIAYATMKGQDVAVLELAARYEDIVRSGFPPWRATLTRPADDEPVVVVGAPLTGVSATSFLRLATCRLDGQARVVLEYIWHWFDSHRNRCADIRDGSSGSPVISRNTGRIVGLLNTSTSGAVAYSECALDHPCEPVRGDVSARTDTHYVTPLMAIDRCFDGGGQFDATRERCPLGPPRQVQTTPTFLGAVNPRLDAPVFGAPRRAWDVAVSGTFDQYVYKVSAAAGGDCREHRGYGTARRVQDVPVIRDLLPQADGYYFLCVLGVSATRGGMEWQDPGHPTVVAVRIDTVPPRIPARTVILERDTAWNVSFNTLDPEIAGYVFKFGRPSDTRCGEPADYRLALVPFVTLSKTNRPYVFCAIPYDSALNTGAVSETLLP